MANRSTFAAGQDADDLYASLGKLLGDESMADAVFVVNDPEKGECRFPVHRVVVASRCQVFRDKLFAVKFPGQTVKVTVKDTTEKVLRNFLHFVYTDSTDKDVDDETVFPLLDLANRFEFPLLAQSCSTHLRNALNADTVGMMLRQAEERGHKEFAHSCRQWVALNAGDVCMDRNVMMKLPLSGIIAVCNSICTGVPELELFKACVAWCYREAEMNFQKIMKANAAKESADAAAAAGKDKDKGKDKGKSGGGKEDGKKEGDKSGSANGNESKGTDSENGNGSAGKKDAAGEQHASPNVKSEKELAKHYFDQISPHIRFPLMAPDTLAKEVVSTMMLHPDDLVALFSALNTAGEHQVRFSRELRLAYPILTFNVDERVLTGSPDPHLVNRCMETRGLFSGLTRMFEEKKADEIPLLDPLADPEFRSIVLHGEEKKYLPPRKTLSDTGKSRWAMFDKNQSAARAALAGMFQISSSEWVPTTIAPADIFQPGVTRPHHCSSPIPGSFVQVALHPRLRFQPYAYGIRISGTAEGRKDIVLPRSWAVEASLDGREGTWDVLSRQKDNTIFESAYEVAIFPIESVERRKPAVVENAASRSAETAGAPPSNEKENGGDVRGELARMREGIYVGDIGQVPPPEHLPGFYRFFRFRMNGPGQVVGGSADTADSAWSFHLGRVELFGNLCVFDATVGRYIHLASASVQ